MLASKNAHLPKMSSRCSLRTLRMHKHVCPVHLVGIPSTGHLRHASKTLYEALHGMLTLREHRQHTSKLLTARSSVLQAYRDIETSIVTENVFSQYMYKTLPTCSHLWNFKKQFCSQLALSGLLSHVMLIGGRIPAKICFARNSGKTFQIDFYPSYDQA